MSEELFFEEIRKRIENIGETNDITQAILYAMESRGFYDCGKYLDPDIWESIKPIIIKALIKKTINN